MKKIFAILLSICVLSSCTSDVVDELASSGTIYGIVTDAESAEPLRAIEVGLYKCTSLDEAYGRDGVLLMKTVTFDDGSYSFDDIAPGEDYRLKITSQGYKTATYRVVVEAGKTHRADMSLVKDDYYMTIVTLNAEVNDDNSVELFGRYKSQSFVNQPNSPTEYGFLYSTNTNPKNNGIQLVATSSSAYPGYFQYKCLVKNLPSGKYYYQAYATNRLGTIYGSVLSFEIK